ncbi:unnamed protein product [Timema podura]|uniref:Prolactin receptor n=1 Tax=Timema podura TaxID=61482 RepID=A0ABN7P0L3_TIMPD|nr:unnamed protein product [Timema podura]
MRGLWDPERWHLDSKQSGTPTEEEGLKPGGMELPKRRLGDPRERVRKEQDGIVLSPQRRSFNSGCYVPANQPTSKCPGSPRAKNHRVSGPMVQEYAKKTVSCLLLLGEARLEADVKARPLSWIPVEPRYVRSVEPWSRLAKWGQN